MPPVDKFQTPPLCVTERKINYNWKLKTRNEITLISRTIHRFSKASVIEDLLKKVNSQIANNISLEN